MENTREIVLDTLIALERGEAFSHQLLRDVLDKYDYLDSKEKAFIKRVTEGTIERRMELDYYLDHYSTVPVKKMKPLIRSLMRMSVYQLLYMDGTPDSAVCNEACKLAAKRKFQNLKGFVNAVLRKIARDKAQLPLPDSQKENLAYLCVRYSMPEWITEMWRKEYGETGAETILKALLEIHPVSLRLTITGKKSREQVVSQLGEAGMDLKANPYVPEVYWATNADDLGKIQPFRDGKVIVQDASSVLAVLTAGIQPGDFVIDVCAAPGGKTILAAEFASPDGKVLAGDVSENKVEKIRENIRRTGQNNIETIVWDAREPKPELFGKADVVILDVPCSGLGVVGKKRDIKYRVTPDGVKELEDLQKEIIRNAWQYVKLGGILLYSTCTIRWEENQGMLEWMLSEFSLEPVPILQNMDAKLREGIMAEREIRNRKLSENAEASCAQILPGIMDMDGFFFAKLRRKRE